jgi:hypothetical protein
MSTKILDIESQSIDTLSEARLLHRMIELAKEAGYTHVRDHWGWHYVYGMAFDEYKIDRAIELFNPKPENFENENAGFNLP